MSIQVLLDALAGPDGEGKTAARQALIDAGAEAVGPLVATLLDEDSPVAWHDAGSILRRIGRSAFAPLAEDNAFSPADRAAVERLIQIKLRAGDGGITAMPRDTCSLRSRL